MVKKEDEDKTRHDFTSIGEMTEFLHPEDMEAELKFKQLNGELFPEKEETSLETNVEDLPDDIPTETLDDLPPDLPGEVTEIQDEVPFEESPAFSSEFSDEIASEESFDSSLIEDVSIGEPESENIFEETLDDLPEDIPTETTEETVVYKEPENFKEVQSFAQNFSYGEIPSGGNPPFSILINNIKFQEDADNILALLREYKILNNENEKDFIKSTEFGVLLVPQINEYLAIILTHKLRRFDCDIEMGLADQIQPSKSGEKNPRGLTNKSHLHQNKTEHFELEKDHAAVAEVISSTTATLVGYVINKYHGVETAFRMLETDDLDRLHFIQNSLDQALQSLDEDTQADYTDFTENFHQLYSDLLKEIKQKALQHNANALLGVSFSLTPFLSTKNSAQNKYQLTCTATLASVTKENTTEKDETI